MSDLKRLKKIYDRLGSDSLRSKALASAELLRIRKDILRMDTNNYCNIQCIMCNRIHDGQELHYMSLPDFMSTTDLFAPSLRNLYLSCACEPLATPNFTEYLRYAKSKKIPFVSFCTNAYAMNRKVIEEIVAIGVDEVIISFNGFTKDSYERIMCGADYERTYDNVRTLAKYKKKHNAHKPRLRLNTILLKSNLLHIGEMIDFVIDNNIDTIQFRTLQFFDGQNNPEEVRKELVSELKLHEQQYLIGKLEQATDYFRYLGKEVILPLNPYHMYQQSPFPQQDTPAKHRPLQQDISNKQQHSQQDISTKQQPLPSKKASCSIPFFSYWLDWKGDVRVCGYDAKGIIGNVFKDRLDFLKIQRKQFQKLALEGECSSELCTTNINISEIY